jgi:mannose-1-phosphate guanylyltransferase
MCRTSAAYFSRTWAIVLAGGSGRRLEPLLAELAGPLMPKQFWTFGPNGRSLLQETLWRITPSIGSDHTLVVLTKGQEAIAARQLEDTPEALSVVQPMDRGTAPAILLPLLHVWWHDPNAMVVVLPSDHAIARTDLFHDGILKARIAIERAPSLVVVGAVEAQGAEEDYGWVVPRTAPDYTHGACLRPVERFVEKPRPREADALFRTGALWSTFVLVAKAATLVELFRRSCPNAVGLLANHDPRDASPASRERLAESYERLPPADFSRDVLATTNGLAVLAWPQALGWTDLGTPGRLIGWLARQGGLQYLTVMRRRVAEAPRGKPRQAERLLRAPLNVR